MLSCSWARSHDYLPPPESALLFCPGKVSGPLSQVVQTVRNRASFEQPLNINMGPGHNTDEEHPHIHIAYGGKMDICSCTTVAPNMALKGIMHGDFIMVSVGRAAYSHQA